MKHKQLTFVLAVLMSMVTYVSSAYDAEVNGIFYDLSTLEATVTYKQYKNGINYSNYVGDIVIPETIFYEGRNYTVVAIGERAFCMCEGLTSVILPPTIVSIGKSAFAWCSTLKFLTFPENVKSIGEELCFRSNNIDSVYCYATTLPKVYDNTFSTTNAGNATLYVPKQSIEAYKQTKPWNYFKNILAFPVPVDSLILETHDFSLVTGKKEKITANIFPEYSDNKDVIWSSSDKNIATVDENGDITAIKGGTCFIKAVSEDNPEAMDSCLVTVVEPVTGVTISHTEYALNGIGKAIQLEAAVQPNDATNKGVTWSSSNESVCTVKDGLVTAKGKGTAIISVKTDDGGFTASCTVTVTQAVTGITLNYENYTLNNIGESVQLTATVTPEDADNKAITWAS
ncbi:MAG: Ig-like domain-containing protein, partial [Bacteroidaceae bacterium]|nr:Ig-like domain-containing protein [Bacteroidaceae bacterium]